MKEHLTLAEMAEASGVPARTIRFYISRGLMNGPVKGGRDAAYTADHLERLEAIKRGQAEGRTLSEMALGLQGGAEDTPAPAAWWQHAVADDVTVWVKAEISPWRMKALRAAVGRFAREVRAIESGAEKEEVKP